MQVRFTRPWGLHKKCHIRPEQLSLWAATLLVTGVHIYCKEPTLLIRPNAQSWMAKFYEALTLCL